MLNIAKILERLGRKTFKRKFFLSKLAYIQEGLERAKALDNQRKIRNEYEIDASFQFNGSNHQFYGDGRIIAGENSYIGQNARIASTEGNKVEIGAQCQLSHNITIYTGNRKADQDFSNSNRESESGNVVIGDNVWIGHSAFIRENTKIGDNSVIGAKSVVTRDIPPHSITVGSPAKVVKFKSYISKDKKKELKQDYRKSLSSKIE